MKTLRIIAAAAFCIALVAGTLTDYPRATAPRDASVLVADFHVHAAPGDGLLPVWEIQREAGRRGLDVIAITNHNHHVATRVARLLGLIRSYPIVIESQELTTPDFHIAAVGASEIIDWRLSAVEAIAATQRAGGVAIASHPASNSWRVTDAAAVRALDGAEAAHPIVVIDAGAEADLRRFFANARQINPDIAAIGSSDFHAGAPIGACRTYVPVTSVSRDAVLDALRNGQTVATCPGGRITGGEALVNQIRGQIVTEQPLGFGRGLPTWIALTALIALAAGVLAR